MTQVTQIKPEALNVASQLLLQNLDLTSSLNLDRKLKLDRFKKDWERLTGKSSLEGAQFIGNISIDDGGVAQVLFTYNSGFYNGISFSNNLNSSIYKVVLKVDGTITLNLLTPISADNLADGAVTADKLAAQSVSSAKIKNGAVTAANIAAGAVHTVNLADGEVTAEKLKDRAVVGAKIDNGAVDTTNLANLSVTEAKLSQDLQDRLKKLQNKLFPLTLSANIVGGNTIFKEGTSKDITIEWRVTIDGQSVPPDKITINGAEVTNLAVGTITYTGITKTTEYTIVATKDGSTASKKVSVVFVYPSCVGVVDSTTTITDIPGMLNGFTEKLLTSKVYTHTFTLDNKKSCYVYPASYKALTAIKDSNNFDYIGSYEHTTVNINDISYNIYLLKDATTISGFVQKYS